MTILYIIGNGFDLWHGLPTRYSDFYERAKEALDEMDAYYISRDDLERPWNDFEKHLGTYDWQMLYDEFNNVDVTSESFRPRDAYGLEDALVEQSENLVDSIQELFREWISEVDISVVKSKFTFDHSSQFLTFNYTETLQKAYGIPSNKVLHIHGNAEASNDLIFGHGESREEKPELDENGDSNRTIFADAEYAAMRPFYAFRKPVFETIEKNGAYFSSLHGITKVVVIGHSLNDIDLPYFQKIATNTFGCSWLVYYYNESDVGHYVSQLVRCGVNDSTIEMRAYC